MDGRIAALHVRYRVPGGTSPAATAAPVIDRVLQAGLAEGVSRELERLGVEDGSVVVVREVTSRIALRPSEWTLDRPMLERLSRASCAAVVAQLGRPATDDSVVRFANEAEFAGRFVVDLLAGSAWDRWYFGAFRRFRRAGLKDTIEAVLAEARIDVLQVFGWLERRGRLGDVLAVLGAARARQLALEEHEAVAERPSARELEPLAAAALALLRALGHEVERLAGRTELVARYLDTHPESPSWADRMGLTRWVWSFMRFVLEGGAGLHPPLLPAEVDPDLLERERSRLDWLDLDWLAARLREHTGVDVAPTVAVRALRQGRLTPGQNAVLVRLAALVRAGTIRMGSPGDQPIEQGLLRLLAALEADGAAIGRPDRALLLALERVLGAWEALAGSETSAGAFDALSTTAQPDERSGPTTARALALASVREISPAAAELLHELRAKTPTSAGTDSSYAGLYLLTRPLSDLRMHVLADAAGVPLSTLLGALAMKLVGAKPPFDPGLEAWVGTATPSLEALRVDALMALQDRILRALVDQRHLAPDTAALQRFEWRHEEFEAISDEKGTCWPLVGPGLTAAPGGLLPRWAAVTGSAPDLVSSPRDPAVDLRDLPRQERLPPAIEVLVTSLATAVFRAWSRWLPGLAGSSLPFLTRNCVARAGRVVVTAREIEVRLRPAPMDVVLEMAGCFQRLPPVSWLGRSLRLSVARPGR